MDERPSEIDCPECAGVARRTMAAPNLARADKTAMALHDRTRATADRPAVVQQLPAPTRQRPQTRNPLHRRLPRN